MPADIAALPRPVIGFYGTLRDWVDLDLIAGVAKARPQWSIALIGQQLDDVATVRGLPNVHLLGRKPHAELPAYCKGFDVGLIPYRIDQRMTYVNPIKLREYLSAGVPVVSTRVPEVERMIDRSGHLAQIADDAPGFVAAIERALAGDSPARRQERSAAMATETWPARVEQISRIVDDLASAKRGAS